MTAIGWYEEAKPKEEKKRRDVPGTHGGSLDADSRRARSAKNARNRSRRGQATRPRGSQSKGRSSGSRRTGR